MIGSLLSSVVHYRLAFGQSRQEELVQMLSDLDPETRAALGRVRVDLTPPRYAVEGALADPLAGAPTGSTCAEIGCVRVQPSREARDTVRPRG